MKTKKSLSGFAAGEAGRENNCLQNIPPLESACQPSVVLSKKDMESVRHSWQSTAKKFASESISPGQDSPDEKPAQRKKSPYLVIAISDFLAAKLPPRENILNPWLPKQGLAMIHSKRGIGKTFMALNIAYAVSCGGKFLSWEAPQAVGVLYLDGEMPAGVIQRRLANIVNSNEHEPQKPFFYMSPDLQKQAMPDLGTIAGQEAVNKHLSDIELVIVDNISTLSRYGKENDASSWLPLQEWCLKLRAAGRSVLFIHHSGKGGFQRGTSRREDILDTVINLRHTQDYEPSSGACFEVHFEKSRGIYGADVEPFEARLSDGVWTTKSIKRSAYEKTVRLIKDGYSQKEIGEEIGKTKGYVSKLVRQAKEKGDCLE
jgi:putative DNA primase/helicase